MSTITKHVRVALLTIGVVILTLLTLAVTHGSSTPTVQVRTAAATQTPDSTAIPETTTTLAAVTTTAPADTTTVAPTPPTSAAPLPLPVSSPTAPAPAVTAAPAPASVTPQPVVTPTTPRPAPPTTAVPYLNCAGIASCSDASGWHNLPTCWYYGKAVNGKMPSVPQYAGEYPGNPRCQDTNGTQHLDPTLHTP